MRTILKGPMLCGIFLLLWTWQAAGQWQVGGRAVCNYLEDQEQVQIVPDGSGGAVIAWLDYRGSDFMIGFRTFAQRLNSNGVAQWVTNGTMICSERGQWSLDAIPDNSGGMYIAWTDQRDTAYKTAAYVQYVSGNGSELWQTNGFPLSATIGASNSPKLLRADNGIFTVWSDSRNGLMLDIYAQKINGSPIWQANGVPVRVAPKHQTNPEAVHDGSGGIFVVFVDDSGGLNFSTTNLFVQRVSSSGAVLWDSAGKAICTAPGQQKYFKAFSHGDGKAIAAWLDYRNGSPQLYAQKWDSDGNMLWGNNGKLVSGNGSYFAGVYKGGIVNDGDGGVIIVYLLNSKIYATRLSPSGTVLYQKVLSSASARPSAASIAPDGLGEYVVAWQDTRNDMGDIYAQKFNRDGQLKWNSSDVALCQWTGQQRYVMACSDNAGGIIGAWEDYRQSGYMKDIYAAKISNNGTPLPVELRNFRIEDQDHSTKLLWQTESETNNKGFYVERMINSKWEFIAFIEGRGTTASRTNYEYKDTQSLEFIGKQISYRLKQVDYNGAFQFSEIVSIVIPAKALTLHQNAPNPFSDISTISFVNDKRQHISLCLFNLSGRLVKEIVSGDYNPGYYHFDFTRTIEAAGMYIIRLEASGMVQQKSMIIY